MHVRMGKNTAVSGYEPNQTGYESSESGTKRPLSVSMKRMKGCWWFKCCGKHSTFSRTKMAKVSSTKRLQILGLCSDEVTACSIKLFM